MRSLWDGKKRTVETKRDPKKAQGTVAVLDSN